MGGTDETPRVSLSELLGALSLGTDLGMGHPLEHALRQTFIALRLSEQLGMADADRQAVQYGSLLAWVGCHVDAYEQAKWFGDDRALKHEIRAVDLGKPLESATFMIRRMGHGRTLVDRARAGAGLAGAGRRDVGVMFENHWTAADTLAAELGLEQSVRECIVHTFERWDGKGEPLGLAGDEVLLASRLVNLADVVEVFHAAGGVGAARQVARARAGTQFDPDLVELFCDVADEIFAELDEVDSWEALASSAPHLDRTLSDAELDGALGAVADFVDVKSPHRSGHSRAVAELAADAAARLGLPTPDLALVRRAGLVHDLGMLGVSNAILDKPGPLTPTEMEKVRLHPYLTQRMLSSCPGLEHLGAVASRHHERRDGSGYPQGVTAEGIDPAASVLAAADVLSALTASRPQRAALAPDEAESLLRAEVREGHLDGAAVDAALAAAGHRVRRKRAWPAGLTAREVEVLRLVAKGLSHRQIAEELVIARKTASNHVERIYAKIGVTNRAMAALFAARHGLMHDQLDGS